MKYYRISALTFCLSVYSTLAMAQNVTIHKQDGVGHVYKVEKVDSVVYFPIGDAEQFPASEAENTTTLWNIIEGQANLSKFAAILKAASYYTGKEKAPTKLQLSQLLDGSVPFSVYAPNDAAISGDKFAELMALAQTDGWKLQQEFVFNHISPQESQNVGNSSVMMLNGKIIGINPSNLTSVNQECNNGKLYVASSMYPYTPNMEEYLLGSAPDCNSVREFMNGIGSSGKTFDAAQSIYFPSKDGKMQILDSIFTNQSPLKEPYLVYDDIMCIKGFGMDLADEKASYSMVMPTDQVWNNAQAKLTPLYRYANRYEDKLKGDEGLSLIVVLPNPDSLSALSVGADIMVPLLGRTAEGQETILSNGVAYTSPEWPVPATEYKPDVEVDLTGKEFYYTSNTSTYYKVGTGIASWDMTQFPMEHITSKYGEVNNGSFYYLVPPSATSNPRVEIKLIGEQGEQVMSGKYDVRVVMVPYWYRLISMPKNLREDTTVRYTYNDMGEVVKVDTITYYPDLYPDYANYGGMVNSKEEDDSTFIADITKYAELLKDEHYVDSISAINKMSLTAQIRYCNNAGNGKDITSKRTSTIEFDGTRVETITVMEDFEFPYSYKNISHSYPTLILDGATKASTARNGFIYGLCIDKVILKSKEDGSVIDVTP